MKSNLTAAYVRSILDYNPNTGVFTWRHRPREHFTDERASKIWNTRYAGTTAGCIKSDGYARIAIDNIRYFAHRLAWLYATGFWPACQIDHVDLVRSNNIFSNLREATHSQNRANRRAQSNNTSGVKGVSLHKQKNKWQAQICVIGKTLRLGYFDTREDAAAAYAKAAQDLHGEFARTE
ncbi:MAG: HNH endonuclease [Hyphomicrobium sp.]|uniref:HNH endonuclease n=1 Tax=Hyphomicrobium sp. TaxID=82 RepID=UPI003569B9F1